MRVKFVQILKNDVHFQVEYFHIGIYCFSNTTQLKTVDLLAAQNTKKGRKKNKQYDTHKN